MKLIAVPTNGQCRTTSYLFDKKRQYHTITELALLPADVDDTTDYMGQKKKKKKKTPRK